MRLAQRAIAVSTLVLLATGTTSAQDEPQPAEHAGEEEAQPAGRIEDPHGALSSFHEALDRTARREPGAVTRISHYGDSLIVADGLTGAMRRRLQARFGDAGHGFILLGKPWVFYRHHNVRWGATGPWRQYRVTHPRARDRLYGLGGVSFRTSRARATAWVATDPDGPVGSAVSRFEISFLRQPDGGSVRLLVDDVLVRTISTRADRLESGFYVIRVPEGPHRLELRTVGDGEVRVFGTVLETDGPGVVYESLAVTGARAAAFLHIDPDHLREQIQRRRPDLVVVGLGTNESSSPGIARAAVENSTGEWLGRLRDAGMRSCLVLSPPDRVGTRAGGDTTPDSLLRVVAAQRQAAFDAGCAFFDTYQAMGGRGSMLQWWRRGYAAADRRHLNERGADALAEILEAALLAGH